jgi:hypothetical protein
MNTVRNILTCSGVGLLLSVRLALAHHSTVAEYDEKNLVTVTGTVSKVAWANPHVRLYIVVTDDKGGQQMWDFELQSTNSLIRRGWSRSSVKVGDVITVAQAARARNGSNRGNARGNVSMADGRKLFTDADDRDE